MQRRSFQAALAAVAKTASSSADTLAAAPARFTPLRQYGPERCPRTIAIHNRAVGIYLDAKFSRRDIDDVIAAIGKIHSSVSQS
jgi:hypothetical protein